MVLTCVIPVFMAQPVWLSSLSNENDPNHYNPEVKSLTGRPHTSSLWYRWHAGPSLGKFIGFTRPWSLRTWNGAGLLRVLDEALQHLQDLPQPGHGAARPSPGPGLLQFFEVTLARRELQAFHPPEYLTAMGLLRRHMAERPPSLMKTPVDILDRRRRASKRDHFASAVELGQRTCPAKRERLRFFQDDG